MKNCGKLRRSILTLALLRCYLIHIDILPKPAACATVSSACPHRFPPARRIENPCGKAFRFDRSDDLLGMPGIAGFDHDFKLRPLGRNVEEHPAMRYLEDIGSERAQCRGDPAKNPRPIIDLDAQIDYAVLEL